jgi:hypothetical protein
VEVVDIIVVELLEVQVLLEDLVVVVAMMQQHLVLLGFLVDQQHHQDKEILAVKDLD